MALRQDSMEGIELTEKLVLTRTRAQDLESVRKLNCWASNIGDVSVVRKMPNLEVCSLSINRISTLRDFAHCHRLKELYVRTNKISCLGDIHYLKSLQRLRSLWLSENPCADVENYRHTVLRTLPHLQKLDNAVVTPEEVQEALNSAEEIPIPEDFSASSLFHPGITDCSVSSVSSIDSRFYKESTDVAVSSDSVPVARKKREQRRLKKAQEESLRKSTEEQSEKSSSGEIQIEMKKKGGSTSDEVCSEDDLKRTNGSGKGDEEDQSKTVIRENALSQSENSKTSTSFSDEEGKGINKSSLSNHLSEGSSTSDSYDSNHSSRSNNKVNDKSDDEGVREKDNEDSNHKVDNQKESITSNDKECDKDFSVSNNAGLELVKDEDCVLSDNGAVKDSEQNSKVANESLLDKIRLNDSLALDDQQCVSDFNEIDDIVLEIDDDKPSEVNIDNDKNNNRNNTCDEDKSKEFDDNTACKDAVERDEEEEKSAVCSVSPVMSHQSVKKPTSSGTSPRARTTNDRTESDDGSKKEERLSKMESVDWEEYNRMRQDLGMKPMERISSTKPVTVNSEITKVRNANILQAVLSLVKELDKDSLDLVASAVKARRDNI